MFDTVPLEQLKYVFLVTFYKILQHSSQMNMDLVEYRNIPRFNLNIAKYLIPVTAKVNNQR